jgi:hypothetical protein
MSYRINCRIPLIIYGLAKRHMRTDLRSLGNGFENPQKAHQQVKNYFLLFSTHQEGTEKSSVYRG